MSKTSQRFQSMKDLKQKRYDHGAICANYDAFSAWYPKCMAWRAGFLRNGGKKLWG